MFPTDACKQVLEATLYVLATSVTHSINLNLNLPSVCTKMKVSLTLMHTCQMFCFYLCDQDCHSHHERISSVASDNDRKGVGRETEETAFSYRRMIYKPEYKSGKF